MDEEFYEYPDWCKDVVYSEVRVRFDWRDRLRLLVMGWATIEVKVFTEHIIGQTKSVSRARAKRLWVRRVGLVAESTGEI